MSAADPQSTETPLALTLRRRIEQSGPIRVADYVAACLTDPRHGYYVRQRAVGADGDFITAPEISQIFGELMGLWSAVVWQQMGSPLHISLIELGPGRGTLMSDALRAARRVPAFLDAARIHLVETSAPMRAAQRTALAGCVPEPVWHDTISTLPPGPAILIANEFLDALPVEQIVRSAGRWHRRTVGLDERGGFGFQIGDLAQIVPPPPLDEAAADGAIFEHAAAAAALLRSFATGRGDGPLAGVIIDYGHEQSRLGDTLQGVRQHRSVSPFESPGETDLTTQVDFEQLGAACRACGLVADGPITQAEFLGALGIVERASRLMAANPAKAGAIEAGVARLMAPAGMGTRFKALGVRSPKLPPLPGFG